MCVRFEVLLGAVRGLSSTLCFNGSPHQCSASSYLPPCRRAVASSRWLIRKSGNVSQIPNHPYTHTDTHTRTHAHTGTHTDNRMWTYLVWFLSGPWAAGPIRKSMSRHTVSVYHCFFFCVDDAKINCNLEREEQQERKLCCFMSTVEALCSALGSYLSREKGSESAGDRVIRNTLFLYCFL